MLLTLGCGTGRCDGFRYLELEKGLSCFCRCEIGTRNWHVARGLRNGSVFKPKQGASGPDAARSGRWSWCEESVECGYSVGWGGSLDLE